MGLQKRGLSCGRFTVLLVVLSLAFFAGCAQKVSLRILKPAEVSTTGIKKVAIGSFEIADVRYDYRVERNGKWNSKRVKLTKAQKKALSNQVRARVVNLLATTPYFKLVYTDKFKALDNDAALQKAISTGGFKTSEIDAIINGKLWLNVTRIDGVEPGQTELEYKQGGREGAFNYNLQVVAFWPYKSIRGTLGLEMKMTRLNPTEVLSVTFDTRATSYKIGGKPAGLREQLASGVDSMTAAVGPKGKKDEIEESPLVLPNFEQIVADMAESIAARFVKKIAVTERIVSYTIATGGDKSAQMLIKVGAYEKALEKLDNVFAKSNVDNPDDLYNQGLCFEAVGDYGLAAVAYESALRIDPLNLIYAQGAGRIDRLKRESIRLKEQLSSKK